MFPSATHKKQSVVICDDENSALTLLCQYIGEVDTLVLCETCSDGESAITAINNRKPDLVFLDIHLPGISGIEVVQQLIYRPKIIFSTAHEQYARLAFDHDAVDYLLKPYTRERFRKALDKVMSTLPIKPIPDTVLLASAQQLLPIPLQEVEWISADGDYPRLYAGGRFFLSHLSMNRLEEILPGSFIRIHRSTIVNLQFATAVSRQLDGYHVQMQDGSLHKVSRSYATQIKTRSI